MNTFNTSYVKRCIWRCLYTAQHLIWHRSPRLTVLLYHSISKEKDFFAVSPEVFEQQMEYIRAHYDIATAVDVEAFLRGAILQRDAIMITFDDGYRDIVDTAGPILKKHNIPGTVFLLSGEVDSVDIGNTRPRLSPAEAGELSQYGILVGSHGCSHRKLTRLSEQEVREELAESRMQIGAHTDTSTLFAYPKGAFAQRLFPLLHDAGYVLAFTTEARAIRKSDYPYAIPRVQVDATVDFTTFKAKLSLAQDWYHTLWTLIMRRTRTVQ